MLKFLSIMKNRIQVPTNSANILCSHLITYKGMEILTKHKYCLIKLDYPVGIPLIPFPLSYKRMNLALLSCLFRSTLKKERIYFNKVNHARHTIGGKESKVPFIRRSSLQRVMKSPHFMWHRLINRRICSVVKIDMLSKYSPLMPFSLNISR